MDQNKRRFKNVTPSWTGAVILDHDNKPKGIPIAPGEEIWLSEKEERLTAEAPRDPADNPFVQKWDEPVYHEDSGTQIGLSTHEGVLVLVDGEARPIGSDRYIPSRDDAQPASAPEGEGTELPADGETREVEVGEEEQTGDVSPDAPATTGPPPEGKPAPGEIVGTPDAPAANDAELARRNEAPTPVRERPATAGAISVPPPVGSEV